MLIIAVLIALSGCDAVLEAFYPEFATSKSGENVIGVTATFEMYPSEIVGKGQYIAGQLIDQKSGVVVQKVAAEPVWNWNDAIFWSIEGNLDFYEVEDGEYEVLVWFEQDGDNAPYGVNEPTDYAVNSAGGTVFALPSKVASGGWLYGEAFIPLY